MKLTSHALARINRGDTTGLRTKLTAHEIVKRIKSNSTVKLGGEIYFWSEPDDCCLTVIVKKNRIVTVYEANRDRSPWMAMLAKHRYFKQEVFEQVPTRTRDRSNAIIVSLSFYNRSKGEKSLKHIKMQHCVWFDFDSYESRMFWTKEFHEMLAQLVSTYLEERILSKKKYEQLHIRLHGKNWFCLVPAYVPFELLKVPSPLP